MRFESHVRLGDGGAQGVGAVGVLPADAELLAAHVAVGGELAVDRAAQVEVADDGRRPQVKHLLHGSGDLCIRHSARALRVDEHAHGLCHADGIRQLHEAAAGKPGRRR